MISRLFHMIHASVLRVWYGAHPITSIVFVTPVPAFRFMTVLVNVRWFGVW